MSSAENPARWAPDPLGRHQYRYWDGVQWTDHVADDGMVGSDPLAPAPPPTATVAPTTPVPGSAPGPSPTAGDRDSRFGAPVAGTGAGSWTPSVATVERMHDPTAVLGRRYGAFVIDAVISLVVFSALFFATASTHTRAEMLRMPGCHLSANDSSQVECNNRAVVTVNDTVYEADIGVWFASCALFTLVYFALMEGLSGASPGKHMTGLRVVTREGTRAGLGPAIVRWLVFAVDGPLSLFLCGIITSSVSAGHRRLGDMAASTFVVGRPDVGRPIAVGGR